MPVEVIGAGVGRSTCNTFRSMLRREERTLDSPISPNTSIVRAMFANSSVVAAGRKTHTYERHVLNGVYSVESTRWSLLGGVFYSSGKPP